MDRLYHLYVRPYDGVHYRLQQALQLVALSRDRALGCNYDTYDARPS